MPSKNWSWDSEAMRYRYPNGRLVPAQYVKNDIFRLANGVQSDLRQLTRLLNSGDITIDQWYRRMKVEIRLSYRASIVAAEGGFANMTPAKWGRFGAMIKAEYKFLDNFLNDVRSGKSKGMRRMWRAGQYGRSLSRFYENWRLTQHKELGYSMGRRRLGRAEHCRTSRGLEGCVELAELGWVTIDEVVPIGETPCNGGCHCSIEYGGQFTL